MKNIIDLRSIAISPGYLACALFILLALPQWADAEKQRVFVLTDISNEPDDEESMVRSLVYANEYDIEGLVATTSTHLRGETREDLIRRQIDAYQQVRGNLAKHADGYPSAEDLLAVTATGQPSYGMSAVGDGKSTAGSQLLLAAADKADHRPIWVSVWGGANTLAQALWDARHDRSPVELAKLVSKLRVYTISDQDDTGRWLRLEFPELSYIVSPSSTDWREYYRATWTGISGDRHYKNGPFVDFDLVDNPWLEANVIENHGPLGALYPKLEYIMEGDTPSFLGLIENGLGWSVSPAYGGWGGRYALYQSYAETRPIWTDNLSNRDTVEVNGKPHTSHQATIWRWRRHFQHDFAARMDWCVAEQLEDANHNPFALLNGDRSKAIVQISAKPGGTVSLSSAHSHDPDGDAITCNWLVYPEAGTFTGHVQLRLSTGAETKLTVPQPDRRSPKNPTIHVVLTVEDDGTPSLVAYRRAIITVDTSASGSSKTPQLNAPTSENAGGAEHGNNNTDDTPLIAPRGFYTKGKYVYTARGEKHVFRGVNRPGYEDKLDGDFLLHENEFREMARWGVNVVRIPMNQHWWMADERGYKAKIRRVIDWTLDNGMTAIADLHRSVRGGAVVDLAMADDESLAFWKDFAAEYKDEGRVLFELYNEPKSVSAEVWMHGGVVGNNKYVGMQQLYDAIRDLGAHNLILIGGLNWGYDLRGLKEHPLSKDAYNVVYSSHLYNYGGKRVENWRECWAWVADSHPVILTEFGYTKDDRQPDGSYALDYEKAVLDFAEQHDIGWTAWAWTSIFLKHTIFVRTIPHTYAPSKGVFEPLTPHGQLIKDNLLIYQRK